MRLRHSILGLLGFAALSPLHVQAQVIAAPSQMNFQGRLATPSGNPVPDGTYSIRFSLHDALSAGTEKWSQTVASVIVKNGTFAVLLNTNTANLFHGNLWLEIKVGADAPLTPRQPLVSVPYAIKANSVPDGSIGAAQITNGSLTADKFATNIFNPLTWLLGGNSGTNPTSQFLGTTDAQPLIFRTNNLERMRLLANGNLGIGTLTPVARVDVRGGENPAGTPAFIVGGMNGTQGQRAIAGLYSTFMNVPADTNARRTADLVAGFDAGAWGTEYLSLHVGNNSTANDAAALTSEKLRIISNGNVGIGTATPGAKLDVNGGIKMTGFQLSTGGGINKILVSNASGMGVWQAPPSTSPTGPAGGELTGTYPNPTLATLASSLAKVSGGVMNSNGSRIGINSTNVLEFGVGVAGKELNAGRIGYQTYTPDALDIIGAGTNGTNRKIKFWSEGGATFAGEVTAQVVTILGGSDVAEPYNVAPAGDVKAIPGYVVAIDPDKVGQMRVVSRAYDTTVAGIVSGANGVNPGITLRQKGTIADGELPVASIGRVWCWCDADASGPIVAGDLLTTSDTPGHAMKALDKERRDGAVIGKAMSSLKSGKGLVLVLVSLK